MARRSSRSTGDFQAQTVKSVTYTCLFGSPVSVFHLGNYVSSATVGLQHIKFPRDGVPRVERVDRFSYKCHRGRGGVHDVYMQCFSCRVYIYRCLTPEKSWTTLLVAGLDLILSHIFVHQICMHALHSQRWRCKYVTVRVVGGE